MTRIIVAILLVLGLSTAPGVAAVRETSDRDIDQAIETLKDFLWAQQNKNGDWQEPHYETRYNLPSNFTTAVTTYALLEAGQKVRGDKRMKRAVDALTKMKISDLRVRALRSMALGLVVGDDKKSPYRRYLIEDLNWLMGGRGKNFRGSWGKSGPEKVGDNMCNQFALMALWESTQAGLQLKQGIFRLAEKVWLERQHENGGWSFASLGEKIDIEPDVRMTAAGLLSLYVCWDTLSKGSGKYKHQEALDRGWEYLDKNFNPDFIDNSYLGFCIQQLGMISGRKFIGDVDWYAAAAAKLAEPIPAGATYRGYWGRIVRAAFELIILSRGRTPLTFNKLNYGQTTSWNYHPRDIARFTHYMKRNFERPMRWGVVKITDKFQTLLDAPILLLEGDKALTLTPEQWKLLREYTLRGGTLLFIPSRNSKPFKKSAVDALKDLYAPQRAEALRHYELQKLPADHPIYEIYKKMPNGFRKAPLWGLSDGTRLLAIICERDIAGAWQRKAYAISRDDFLMGVKLFFYTTGQNSLSSRLRPVFTSRGKTEVRHTAKVGWLKHGGNWNTQPYALDYLSLKLTAENRLGLKITRGCPITKEELKGHDLLWMTGSDKFNLSSEELSALREYLEGGGTLMINAVGGARDFDDSARAMLEKLTVEMDISGDEAPITSPLYTGKSGDFRGPKINSVKDLSRTVALKTAFPQAQMPMYVYRRDGQISVIYVRNGIHDTLDGHTAYGARSYMPSSAQDLAANIVLYTVGGKTTPAKPSRKKDPARSRSRLVRR
ncbi:MAG TPA: DUF4159 domain-containing protein [Phycisphaerae bacterium]|nr:DUF4159 domain-containing protein [Phycisphaerae bacterium]